MNLQKDFSLKGCRVIHFLHLNSEEKELVRRMRNHPSIRCWMYSQSLISSKEHNSFFAGLKDKKRDFYWMVKKDGQCLGVIYLNDVDAVHRHAYLGIYTNPYGTAEGKGSCLIECLKYVGFVKARLHTIKLEVVAANTHAINFYRKHGFKPEGKLREFVSIGKKWQDVIIMGSSR